VLQKEDDRQKGVYQQCIPLAQSEINDGKGAHKKEEPKHDSSRYYEYKKNPNQYDSFSMVPEEFRI
jgi:hypothetical protein